ncbi:hypothetical protein [Roseovarius pelagicus]|uniref:NADH-quinone oxidoreductase subunit E n=1 Tax=Roseovarius pelagicus TaxID=2980108 RepID=A0ABY6DCU7_9RHOB|nr:hypothetical protein [Roseovarius pelagicus]UXX83971.1 hypothetical protein N7U68_04765 [Roseovarius pelagicus]
MMTDDGTNCSKTCWMMAAAAGVVLAILLMAVIGLGWFSSLLLGVLVFVICGVFFPKLFCGNAASGGAQATPTAPASRAPEVKPAATPAASPVPDAPTMPMGDAVPPADAAPADAIPPDAEPVVAAPAAAPPAAAAPAPLAPEAQAQPETLSAARGGNADNLKLIKGVGPKLEALLNKMGFYHFDQIAGWTAKEVAWVDQNLEGFKGRVSRDNWVEQAKTLAEGGETEFSKRSKGKK